ncbi:phosphoglycerate mutase [Dyella jejuensis]|uniref:Phosphoglycerate mutase n=1 Tax=Dyella jejuensis TaxID=1432009 RepID=A0ABW8JIV3_9GAMM
MHESTPAPLEIWLPALSRFPPGHPCHALLARADRRSDGARGYLGGLADHFHGVGGLSAAALTRELLAGDAAQACWLCADPAWVQPDLNGARLLACGQLALTMDEALALAQPLKPVFGDAGMTLEVSSPDRWHLRLPSPSPLPDFSAPEQALGEDLFEHLPQGPDGRRWRVLLNEVQVLLHQHPVNAERRARGLPPVNSLWLWGGGTLPQQVTTKLAGVLGDDPLLLALAHRAGIPAQSRNETAVRAARAGWLVDLQDQPMDAILVTWWPMLQELFRRQALVFTFASGERWLSRPWHRLRFWRRTAE